MLLIRLFLSFIQVGLFSVGGGYAAIPLIQNQIVNIHGLMTLEEFTDLITIAEMTPGPISINSSTFVGMRLSGPFGVILCTLGCIIPSFSGCPAPRSRGADCIGRSLHPASRTFPVRNPGDPF